MPSRLCLTVAAPPSSSPLLLQVISQVRFSDLEVPTDAQILLNTLRQERKARTAAQPVPSTYAADVAAIAGELC